MTKFPKILYLCINLNGILWKKKTKFLTNLSFMINGFQNRAFEEKFVIFDQNLRNMGPLSGSA